MTTIEGYLFGILIIYVMLLIWRSDSLLKRVQKLERAAEQPPGEPEEKA